MHTGKSALTLLLFKRWLLVPWQKGASRWLAHFALLSFALAIALLLPVHHSLKAGVYYAAGYDYRIINLGLTVVLYVLGCILVGLYACRTVQQLVSQHRGECVTLRMLGVSRPNLAAMTALLIGTELLSAGFAAVLSSKVIVQKLMAFEYSMAEQALFCVPYVMLIALSVVIASGFSCVVYTRFQGGR